MSHPSTPRATARHRLVATLAAVFLAGASALALSIVPAAPASAHDFLVSSTPKADASVTTPLTEVTLTFNDVVLNLAKTGSTSIVQVTDDEGAHYESGCPATSDRDVTTPVALGAPGKYHVTWQIVSADGHTVSNEYAFAYAPPAGTPQAKGTTRSACNDGDTSAPAQAAQNDGDNAAPNEQSTQSSGEAIMGTTLAVVGGIFVLVVIGVAVALLTARRRAGRGTPRREDDEDTP